MARKTGSDAIGAILLDVGGRNVQRIAARVRSAAATGLVVTDIVITRRAIGSSLASVDLHALTRVELSFALLLIAAAGGLVIGLDLAERRQSTAIAVALSRVLVAVLRGVFDPPPDQLTVPWSYLALAAGIALAALAAAVLVPRALAGVLRPRCCAVCSPGLSGTAG